MNESLKQSSPGRDEDDAPLADWVADLVERLEEGEPVDLSALALAHPERAEELRRVIPTIQRMASFGRAVAGTPDRAKASGTPHTGIEIGTLGDFRLLREIGRGGMGIVYETEQISLGRRVALKILPLAGALDPRQHQRFLLEARAAACLHHPNIVPVYAVGSERGVPYYAMHLINGCTLAQFLESIRGRHVGDLLNSALLPAFFTGSSNLEQEYIRAVAQHGQQAAEALDHAHGRGIIHRDIKPANLMLDRDGHLWITDFGLARIQGDSRLTFTGDVLGTLRYMSPEQALARRVVVDGRTDLYSLGATIYEMLTLRPVFEGDGRTDLLRKIAEDEPTPLRKLNPAVPRDLATIVHKTLSKDPGDRYATAQDLADDFERFLGGRPIAVRPPGWPERVGKWARRNRGVVVPVGFFALIVLIATAAGLVLSNEWLNRHNERLQLERNRAEELSGQLKSQRDLADRHLYAFRIRQASEALRARQFERAQEILRDCRPNPDEEDPREFAWHYLLRESRMHLAVLSERDERVWTFALTADGRTLATGDRDGTIRLRDSETGTLLRSFRGAPFPVQVLAFSPDGSLLASGTCSDPLEIEQPQGEVLVWNTSSGKPLARLEPFHKRWPGMLRFTPSGAGLWEQSAASLGQEAIGFWNLESIRGGLRPRLLKRWNGFVSFEFPVSADGRFIAVHEDGHQVVVQQEPGNGQAISRLPRQPSVYECAGLSSDGRLVAVAFREPLDDFARIEVWDSRTGQRLVEVREKHFEQISRFKFDSTGRFLVGLGSESSVVHIDLSTGKTWRNLSDQRIPAIGLSDAYPLANVNMLALSYAGLPVGAQSLQIRNPSSGEVWLGFPGRSGVAHNMLVSPSGRSLLFVSGEQSVVWHFAPSADPQPTGHSDEAWGIGYSSDGRILATGSDDDDTQTLKLWDAATGRLLRGWRAHDGTTAAVAFQPGGGIVASAGLQSTGNNLCLWDIATGNLLSTLVGHIDKVRSVAFGPDGRMLASAGSDLTIRLWEVATRRCIRTLAGHTDVIRQIGFHPGGRMIASASNDRTVRIWTIDGTAPVWSFKGAVKIAAVAFAPDGRTVAWAQEDGVIQRLDLAEMRLLAPLHCEQDELRCLAFSSDSRTVAAAGKSGSIHLWDPVSGQELLTLEGRACQVNSIAFSPDGSALAACWHDGTVRIVRAR